MRRSVELVDRDQLLLRQISTENTSLSELFNIAMAFALAESHEEEISVLKSCAQGGYLPARAIYPALAAAVHPEKDDIDSATKQDWAFKAVASGFLFAQQSFRASSRYKLAKDLFRKNGGYNRRFDEHSQNLLSEKTVDFVELPFDNQDYGGEFPLHFLSGFGELETSIVSSWTQDVNAKDLEGDTPLLKCCKAGNIDNLRMLSEHKPEASICDDNFGITPLHWLFVFPEEHIPEAAALLSDMGADFASRSNASAVESFHFPFAWPSGGPIHWASFAGCEAAVRALVAHGADVNQEDAAHQTSLCIAMKMGNVSLVKLFLSLGANLRGTNTTSLTSEFGISESDYDPLRTAAHDFLAAPIDIGIDVELDGFEDVNVYIPPNYDAYIFMGNEVHDRVKQMMGLLCQQWPQCFSWLDSYGCTPVHIYARYAVVDNTILEYFLKMGPTLDDLLPSQISVLALYLANNSGVASDSYLESLIERFVGAVMSKDCRTVFLNRQEPKIVGLNAGIDSYSLLHFAAQLGFPKFAKRLLALGASPQVRTADGRTPVDFARDALSWEQNDRHVRLFSDSATAGAYPQSK